VRIALTISAVAHVLLWVPLTWSPSQPLPASAEEPLVVDIVSADQVPEPSKDAAKPADKPQMEASAEAAGASNPLPSEAKPAPKSEAKSDPKPDSKPAADAKAPAAKPSAAKAAGAAKPSSAPAASPGQGQDQAQAQPLPQPSPVVTAAVQAAPSTSWLETATMSPPVSASPFDVAETGANLADDEVKTFRAHMQTCWKPSAELANAKSLMVVLRVSLNPDGALAAEPSLLAASAAQEGPALIETATRALRQCQPYGFLPAAKYKEWKLLDLAFTPAGLSTLPKMMSSALP